MKKLLGALCIFFILFIGCSLEQFSSTEVINGKKSITNAIVEFYGNTSKPIIIYEQIPFEGGTLVLAEMLTEGEHYPDLHFVDENNKVTYLTQGSYCWTLNYTQFKGHYIYFGLAGFETRQYTPNPVPVQKVVALFAEKAVSVSPSKKIIEHINPLQKDSQQFYNPQGYIMPIQGRDIPEDLLFTLKNGDKKFISAMHIERSIDHMPDYLKSKKPEVYNSFAFTFIPMLTPSEWDQGYKDGEICLEGKTDMNGNLNALFLQATGHMSSLDSFILPQDIKPLYLSDNYPRLASFLAGEKVTVKYPEKRELLDCRILRLTREKVEKEIGQDSLTLINTDEKSQIILPKEKGNYLFLLRTKQDSSIQTYTGMFVID